MKHSFFFLSILIFISCKPENERLTIQSPSGNLEVEITTDQQKNVFYQVTDLSGGTRSVIIAPSSLGLRRMDSDFSSNLRLVKASEVKPVRDNYSMNSGKQKNLSYEANETILGFINEDDKELRITFRVFDEGVAFRYEFPGNTEEEVKVESEITGFKVRDQVDAWMSPYQPATPWGNPAYEADYLAVKSGTPSPEAPGWAFPLMFHTGNHWIFISEAGLDAGYCATHIQQDCNGGYYSIAFPEADERLGDGEVYPASTLPWKMPWRFIIIAGSLNQVVESSMVYHLSEKSRLEDTSWIIPGRASWSWWSGSRGRSVRNLKRFIDLSADMGWEYSLVDAGWQRMPDGNIEDVISYAGSKDVGLLLWYTSGGRRDSTRSNEDFVMFDDEKRAEEMKKLNEWGIKGIKVDFFSTDKQFAIKLYEKIMADAARNHLLVDFHGCTLPRGWTRTYPNLLTMEAVRGEECYRYAETYPDTAPSFNTIAAIMRTTVGPTDYTPAAFSNNRFAHLTSAAHELALTVVYESGIIHMADSPESYSSLPEKAREFLSIVPADWDETKLIKAVPGELFVIARRKDSRWYVAGISGKNEIQEVQITLPEQMHHMVLLNDAESGSGLTVDEIEEMPGLYSLSLMPNGGFVMYPGD